MKLRTKPQKPKQKHIPIVITIYSDDSLLDILNRIDSQIPLENLRFEYDISEYEGSEFYFAGSRPETDEEFQKRMIDYEKCLVSYKQWYNKNKEKIQVEQKKRQLTKKNNLYKANEQQKKKLQQDILAAQKTLKQLQS